ncbi:hypothetical protein IKG_02180 [Bacillus cereus VD200]|nr:hypothetical protein IKG_02180 [Bacillus cereus VD200]
MYREGKPVILGESGPGCSATVVYGYLLNRMKKGEFKRILVVAIIALRSRSRCDGRECKTLGFSA